MEVMKHEILEQKMCKELDTLEEKYRQGVEMSIQDLEKIDKLYHALKSMATYNAMKEAEAYGQGGDSPQDGYSGRRGRGPDGRYMSRDMGPHMSGNYDDGYSGHYPMYPRDYYPRQW